MTRLIADCRKGADFVLDVTPAASVVIAQLVASNEQAGAAGLRIAPVEEPAGAFSLSVTSGPQEEDQVIPIQDGQVFLETTAADALEDKTLDVKVDDEGDVSFTVVDQAAS
jgi:Fe-S cluster assembly iron-binding protein IscA